MKNTYSIGYDNRPENSKSSGTLCVFNNKKGSFRFFTAKWQIKVILFFAKLFSVTVFIESNRNTKSKYYKKHPLTPVDAFDREMIENQMRKNKVKHKKEAVLITQGDVVFEN